MPMQTELEVYGPYPIPHESLGKGTSKRITRPNAKDFWADKVMRSIASKQGCYTFALKYGSGFTPWYVGKATKTFEQEALADHKLVHFNEVIFRGHKGTPVMFFVARPGKSRKISPKEIDDIETFLIQSASYKNPDLQNIKKKKSLPLWGIKGVIRGGRGKTPANAKVFKTLMGI